ncbi:MAG: PHP domain-containing protein [Clostridia bacterium]|nr:PHP domain-containing protein [Clostridia bacterium]
MNLKQLKNQLSEEYGYRIELHAHTSPASGCSDITPREMAEIYHALGYDGIVITNHFQYKEDRDKQEYIEHFLEDYEETKRIAEPLGLRVYLGAEIRFTENRNDYLIYGVERKMLEEIYDLLPKGIEYFRKSYAMPKSLFVQAHPMRDKMESVDPALLDGVEAYNLHPGHNSRVGRVAVWCRKNHIPLMLAGSDFHHKDRGDEGLCALRVKEMPADCFALAALLRSEDWLLELGGNLLLTDR